MHATRTRRTFLTLLSLGFLVALPLAALRYYSPTAQQEALPSARSGVVHAADSPLALLTAAAERPLEAKIAPSLVDALETAKPGDREWVVVRSAEPLDLARFDARSHAWRWPAGEHIAVAQLRTTDIPKLAALPGVAMVQSGDPSIEREQPGIYDPDMAPQPFEPLSYEARMALIESSPDWSETEAILADRDSGSGAPGAAVPVGSPAEIDGWFDARKGHSAAEAWGLGYRGAGVRVAVLDTSTDFAHQDLQDSWATVPEGLAHEGWPQTYDPYAAYLHTLDLLDPEFNPGREAGSGFIELYQTSDVTPVEGEDGGTYYTACFAPRRLIVEDGAARPAEPEVDCNYKVPASDLQLRYGHHPDGFLADLRQDLGATPPLASEYVGVLAVSSAGDGNYDTVYVDTDSDRDFTDEKPVTKDSPLSWGEFGEPDGIADLSGGLLYFIADGETPVPAAYLWGLDEPIEVEDGEPIDPIPAAGTMVAFHYDTGGHGTLCASNVASRGRLGVPPGTRLEYRDVEGGSPNPMNPGMAPESLMVAVGSIYSGPQIVMDSAWRYGVLGHDPDSEADDIQITSNSYGFSGTDNDGWDESSRVIDFYVRTFNRHSLGMYSTGNGAPGYGTLAPPSPRVGMGIAASTQMGSTGWDSITDTRQIAFGDVTPWSNRGPGATGDNGPNVAADGAYAAGANPVNSVTTNANRPEYQRSGEFANATWGGTSRSSPIAAGIAALVYQAYRDTHGEWPTYDVARDILMAGARFNGYDVFTVGAGVLDAGDAVRTAMGRHGLSASPSAWTAGDFMGEVYPGFARLVAPGEERTETFSLTNHAEDDVAVTLSAQALRRTSSFDFEFSTQPVTHETGYVFSAPNYFLPIDPDTVPEGTDLMVVRAIYPLDQADSGVSDEDPDGNQTRENAWRMGVYQHTDWNDDGLIFTDHDGDGTVDTAVHDSDSGRRWGLDSAAEIDFENSEIQRWEYGRIAYNGNDANNLAVLVHHPLERWSSGLYIALWHLGPRARDTTDFDFRIEFYDYDTAAQVELSAAELTVPGAGEATFDATLSVPEDAAYGAHQLAIFADYARGEGDEPVFDPESPLNGGWEPEHQRLVIPVNYNVAADYEWEGSVTLGGDDARDDESTYNNGAVQGTQSWSWRAESGDWRFFFVNALRSPRPGTLWLARTSWQGAEGARDQWNDVDTRIHGPDHDRFSDPDHPDNSAGDPPEDISDPSWYGPYSLSQKGASARRLAGGGRWAFDTSSGGPVDWLTADAASGLHLLMWHNVLLDGLQHDLPVETTLSSIRVWPEAVTLYADGCAAVQVESQIDIDNFQAQAFGLVEPISYDDEPIGQDDANNPATSGFKLEIESDTQLGAFEIELLGRDVDDLDLFLLYDADGNGEMSHPQEVLAQSTSPTAAETIALGGVLPAGRYEVWVHGWSVPGGTSSFDMTVSAPRGDDLVAGDVPDVVSSGEAVNIEVCADLEDMPADMPDGPMGGVLLLGTDDSPSMFRIEVEWLREPTLFPVYLPIARFDGS